MPKFKSKHGNREQVFKFSGYDGGYVQDRDAKELTLTELSECMNLKYGLQKDGVVLNVRQGTTVISNTALGSAADVLACTYYVNQSKYILATATKLYYLDSSSDPVEIGTIEGVPTFTEFNSKLIIHDSGVMKSWDGTTFQSVTRLFQNEILGTGDDIETQFTGNLSNLTVTVSSITITFTGTAVTKTITDDGAGALTGDVDGGGTNTINYTNGAYDFTCSEAPDCATTVTVDYQEVAGAAKGKAGFIRGKRLYTYGDSDNTSRLTYTEVGDETGSDTSSGGGYLDIDPNDGYTLLGCINFFTTVMCFKQQSLHRIDNFPDDANFSAEKLTDDVGCLAHRTPMFEGGIISFLGADGWMAMHPNQRFGDVQKGVPLSANFKNNAVRYANATAYAAFNQLDNQLWLSLSTDASTTYLDYIYVMNLDVNGVASLYRFNFSHTCFSFVNGEMLIGGADGKLYKLDDTNTVFTDNSVAYTNDTYFRSAYTDWGLPNNRKHNKRIQARMTTAATTLTAKLKLFRDGQEQPFKSVAISTAPTYPFVFDVRVDVYDMKDMPIFADTKEYRDRVKFNYRKLMYEIRDIAVTSKSDIKGMDFTSAVIGE